MAEDAEEPVLEVDRGRNGGGDVLVMEHFERECGDRRAEGVDWVAAADDADLAAAAEPRRVEAIGNENGAAGADEIARLAERGVERDVLEAFREEADVDAARWRGILETNEVDLRARRVRAAMRGEKRRGDDDLDLVAELARRLARAAANVEDAQGPSGRSAKSLSVYAACALPRFAADISIPSRRP
jgi:hypothetical protein